MLHSVMLRGLVLSFVALLTAAAHAANEAAIFDQLYGNQLRQASATPSTEDDVELCTKLMTAAQSVSDSPTLQVLIYDKAFELGLGSGEGLATSLAAYDELTKLKPQSRLTYRERLMTGFRVQFARASADRKLALGQHYIDTLMQAADETVAVDPQEAVRLTRMALPVAAEVDRPQVEGIRRRIDELVALGVTRNRARQLHDRLAANPDDKTAAKALAELYLIELDDPAQAAKIAPASGDVDLILLASRAARDPAGAVESDSLAVADWYAGISRQAPGFARPAMIRRAVAWYGRFLELHTDEDAARLKAQVVFNQLNDQLQEMGVTIDASAPTTVATATANAEVATGRVAPLLKDVSVTGSIKLDDVTRPYVIQGQLMLVSPKMGRVDVEIGPGVVVEGGRIQMSRQTRVIIKGTPDRPVVLRNVVFGQDISSGFEAEYAILENCRFGKTGRWFLVNGYTSKWTFRHCLLYQCTFPNMTKRDYGFKFLENSLVSTTIDGAGGDIGHVWNAIRNCNFIDCTIHPSLGIRTTDCNFYICQFDTTADPYPGEKLLMIEAYISGTRGPSAQAAWAPLGPNVHLNPALAPFAVFKFDCVPPIPALRSDRTARSMLFLK